MTLSITDVPVDTLSGFVDYDGHERVCRVSDPETGLTAFIGVHNRNLGPALGGCRFYPYADERDAIRDVLRLSRGMTYKNALAGLPLGGGKAVIIGDPFTLKTPELMRAMGRAVQSLNGHYITAEDSGTSEHDMVTVASETEYVVGLPAAAGDLGGNPSPITAYGVFTGIQSTVKRRYGGTVLTGVKVAIQGLGAVGYDLALRLQEASAQVVVSDIRPHVVEQARAEIPGVHVVQPDQIFSFDANVFAPCALGAQVNEKTIPQMSFDIIAGAANNQIATAEDEKRLAEKKILYVPDYAINAGGVIAVSYEYFRRIGRNPFSCPLTRDNMMAHVERIGTVIDNIIDLAAQDGITTARAADRLAESIFLSGASGIRNRV